MAPTASVTEKVKSASAANAVMPAEQEEDGTDILHGFRPFFGKECGPSLPSLQGKHGFLLSCHLHKAWHTFVMSQNPLTRSMNLRRSVLSVPAINARALEKTHLLDCDAVIFDLEDSVAPEKKAQARENLRAFFPAGRLIGKERIIRINEPFLRVRPSRHGAGTALEPDAVLLPKVDEPQNVMSVSDLLADADAPESLRIWAMIETPRGILNAAAIAEAGRTAGSRLDCFVVGLNDLRKETGVLPQPGRTYLVPWLMQVILAVRAYGLDAIDSVFNDFKDSGCIRRRMRAGPRHGLRRQDADPPRPDRSRQPAFRAG
jgi:citrate lyase beta subunit